MPPCGSQPDDSCAVTSAPSSWAAFCTSRQTTLPTSFAITLYSAIESPGRSQDRRLRCGGGSEDRQTTLRSFSNGLPVRHQVLGGAPRERLGGERRVARAA